MTTHFISAPSNIINQGTELAHTHIKKEYDYAINLELFQNNVGFKLLDKYISKFRDNCRDKLAIVGGDISILPYSINSKNGAKIIIMTPTVNINILNQILQNNISTDQLLYYGLNRNDNIEHIYEHKIKFLNVKKINQLKNDNIIKYLHSFINNSDVYVVLDLSVFDKNVLPSTSYSNNDGLKEKNVINILQELNIMTFILIELNPKIKPNFLIQSSDIAKKCLSIACNFKMKNINVFNEYSEFLIYRSVKQINPFVDIGWYILRGVPKELKQKLFSRIRNGMIETIEIDEEDYLITKTTMDEQNKKCFESTKLITDCVLFPGEKRNMLFELIN